ncbi:MAG: twin-arginine translocase TatA/TatE family subunit [Deltaproteobacteria bacterium]|nr:twin-arginine translocase TatA/TatE family subunit [Deltaproteobacteria bacterium]
MFGLGWTEILVILGVALLVLGPAKLPQIAKSLGRGIRDFRRAVNSLDEDPPPKKAVNQTEIPAPRGEAAEPAAPEPKPQTAAPPPEKPEEGV